MKVLSNLADSHVYSDLFQGLGLFADSLYCSDLFDDEVIVCWERDAFYVYEYLFDRFFFAPSDLHLQLEGLD